MAQQEYGMGHSMVYGQWLGWMMTAIYMGGRIPQIWLNVSPTNFVSWALFCLAIFAARTLIYMPFSSLVVFIYSEICCLLFYQIKRGSVEVWPCKNFLDFSVAIKFW